ncbi:MAG: DUF6655 family protein [Fuerstiella sp.]
MIHNKMRLTIILVGLTAATGCASTLTSNTARTAREQMLLSNAVDRSLNKVDFTPLYGQKVYVEEKYLECVDKPYVVGSVRHRALRAGALLTDKADEAQVVMELRSGGVGTDTTESYLGTTEIALPGLLTIPEIRFAERKTQFGYAKLGLVIYDAETKQVLGDGGVALARSDDSNWYVAGIGPFQKGSLKRDVGRASTHPESMSRRELPSAVAFGTRSDFQAAPSVQFASQPMITE